jgi:hypothetical protein
VSTRYQFPKETVESFCDRTGVTVPLTREQEKKLEAEGKTELLVSQLSGVAGQLCPDENALMQFVERMSETFHPVSLSLYVLNHDLWRTMSRKWEHPETMLPMATIPWFYWDKDGKTAVYPSGVRKKRTDSIPLDVRSDDSVLTISGHGGDFCGLVEGRIVDRFNVLRPMLVPGSPGPRQPVPYYEPQQLQIRINRRKSKAHLYPTPAKELDYIYSENPRVFYEHGIQIDADGTDVYLKSGKGKELPLRGDVRILLGKDFTSVGGTEDILMFHVWLLVLSRIPLL